MSLITYCLMGLSFAVSVLGMAACRHLRLKQPSSSPLTAVAGQAVGCGLCLVYGACWDLTHDVPSSNLLTATAFAFASIAVSTAIFRDGKARSAARRFKRRLATPRRRGSLDGEAGNPAVQRIHERGSPDPPEPGRVEDVSKRE